MANQPDFIHVFEPPAPGEGDLTLLLLHGTGGSESDLIPLGRQLAPGAGLLSPRGKVLEGGVLTRFFRRHGEGLLDVEDLRERTDEMAEFLEWTSVDYDYDPAGLVALGFSNGANVATTLLFRHPDLLAGAALLRPMLPYQPDPLPDLAGKSVLILAGENDPMVPLDQPRDLASLLAEAGASVEAEVSMGVGHNLSEADLNSLANWIQGLRGK